MAEIIGVITSVEDDSYDGKDFKKVTLGTGQVLKVKHGREGALKAKWDLLKEGVAIKFIMQDYTKPDGVKIPFVSNIETVEGSLPPPTKATLLPEQQEIIDEALREPTKPATREQSIETQVAIKEIGECWRMGKFKDDEGLVIAYKLWLIDKLGGKDVKATKEVSDKKAGTEPVAKPPRVDDSGGGGETPEWADWLKEAIKETDWTNIQWAGWLIETFSIDPAGIKTLSQAVKTLTDGQRLLFFLEIEQRQKK